MAHGHSRNYTTLTDATWEDDGLLMGHADQMQPTSKRYGSYQHLVGGPISYVFPPREAL